MRWTRPGNVLCSRAWGATAAAPAHAFAYQQPSKGCILAHHPPTHLTCFIASYRRPFNLRRVDKHVMGQSNANPIGRSGHRQQPLVERQKGWLGNAEGGRQLPAKPGCSAHRKNRNVASPRAYCLCHSQGTPLLRHCHGFSQEVQPLCPADADRLAG